MNETPAVKEQEVLQPVPGDGEPEMKKTRRRILSPRIGLLCTVILLLVVSGLLYKRPVTLAKLYPELDFGLCTGIRGDYCKGNIGDSVTVFSLEPGDPDLAVLCDLLQKTAFIPKFSNLLPRGTKTHALKDEDVRWDMVIRFAQLAMPAGDTAIGDLLDIGNFYGTIELRAGGNEKTYSVKDQEQWLRDVEEILLRHVVK